MMTGLAHVCRDCGNRSKPVRHGVGWCFQHNCPVPLGIPRSCDEFTPRGKGPLRDPPEIHGLESKVAPPRQR